MCYACDREKTRRRHESILRVLILTVLAIVALVTVASARADEFLWSPVYDTLDEAATAALGTAVAMSLEHDEPVEYMGGVYKLNGKYLYTFPVTQGKAHRVEADIAYPTAATLVGLYHNHPREGADRFSVIDVRTARELDVTSYIAAPVGNGLFVVRKWSDDMPRSFAANDEPRGELVGQL